MTFSPSIDAVSLTDPNNVFELQNNVSDNLNMLQDKYSRYIRFTTIIISLSVINTHNIIN